MTLQPFYTAFSLQIPYSYNLPTSPRAYVPGALVTKADSQYRFLHIEPNT
uniref:Uncharacterized protein LOC105133578 isoform X2 n=1 Tax=Rhizophora mucronata TaxID=61149 RepID=A0A2P2L573_RHIMU